MRARQRTRRHRLLLQRVYNAQSRLDHLLQARLGMQCRRLGTAGLGG